MNKAVFVDRDGTMVRDAIYCNNPDDLDFLPTVLEGIKILNSIGLKLIVVTNQSGIARGFFTEETLGKIHEKMLAVIIDQGGHVDAIYYCPHHPDEKCQCRKPNIGMLEKAAQDWSLDLSSSFFIGDKFLDMEAANKAGCKAILVPSEAPETDAVQGKIGFAGKLDYISSEFLTAAKWVKKQIST